MSIRPNKVCVCVYKTHSIFIMAAECLNPQQNTNQTIFTHLYAATAREACVCNMEKLPKYQHTPKHSLSLCMHGEKKIPQPNRA